MNVLLIVLGSVRADHVSCAGYHRETTPFLDEIAREGVRYQNMLTTAPSSVPAHASLLTGLFAATHGVTEESPELPSRWRLLPEFMQEAGYCTGAFCADPQISPMRGFGRGFERFWGAMSERGLAGRAVRYARDASERVLGRRDLGPRRLTQSLLEWVGTSPEPFFGFVHYKALGWSTDPPAPYDRMFRSDGASRRRGKGRLRERPSAEAGSRPTDAYADTLPARYDGKLRYLDDCLREVGRALRQRGRWDQTLLIVTADHGENLGEYDMEGHETGLYDGILRIPLVLRCPSLLPRGFVVDELTQSVDVMPTILQLTGIELGLADVHGRPLFVDGQACAGRPFTITESFRAGDAGAGRRPGPAGAQSLGVRRKAIRTRREKFIWDSQERNELYDLVRDPLEQTNIIEEAAGRAVPLRRALFDWLASVDRFQATPQEGVVTAAGRWGAPGCGHPT